MKVTSDKVSDLLVNRLQTMIKTQQLQAGMRLPSERTLAAELQVSRASVREALQKLNSRGLLSTRPGGGSYLCKPLTPWADQRLNDPVKAAMVDDPSYQSDILEARQTLEAGTAWYAALRATEEDKQRLQYCYDALCELQLNGDAGLIARADARFHLMIAEASHNAVLLETMRGLFDLLHSSVLQSRQQMFTCDDIVRHLSGQHQQLLEAILRGDAAAARDAAMTHLSFVHNTTRPSDKEPARQGATLTLPDDPQTRTESNS